MLAGLSVLTTIARYRPRNLVVIVVDNHAYVTTGSIPSATANANGTDLVAMAKGAGIDKAFRATDPGAFEQCMKRSVGEDGPFFIVADVEKEDLASVGKSKAMPFDIVDPVCGFGVRSKTAGWSPRSGPFDSKLAIEWARAKGPATPAQNQARTSNVPSSQVVHGEK